MPLAVTLPVDEAAAARIRRLGQVIADVLGEDAMQGLGYGPHLTLAVVPTGAEEEVAACAFGAMAGFGPVALKLSGFGIFPGAVPVLWLAPAVSGALLARQAVLAAALARFGLDPHHREGAWVPHVTLRVGADVTRAVELALRAWDGPIAARLEAAELVRFPPAVVLRREALPVSPPSCR